MFKSFSLVCQFADSGATCTVDEVVSSGLFNTTDEVVGIFYWKYITFKTLVNLFLCIKNNSVPYSS